MRQDRSSLLMRLVVWLWIFLGFLSWPAQESRAASFGCDLLTCIQVALERHPDLQVGEAKKLAAQATIRFEKAEWLPRLDARAEQGYLNGESTSPFAILANQTEEGTVQQSVNGVYSFGSVSLSAPIMKEGRLFGVNSPSIQQAHFNLNREENLELVRRGQIIYAVKEAYINVLKASTRVSSQEQGVQLTTIQYNEALGKFKQKMIARNDLLLAQVQLATARRDLTLLHNALGQSKRKLGGAMGLGATTEVEAQGTLTLLVASTPLPSFEALAAFAYRHRYEFQEQQAMAQAKQEEVKRLQGERWPTLDLTANYSLVTDYNPPVRSQWQAAVRLSVPVFDFGRTTHKIRAAQAEVTEEIVKVESLKVQVADEIREAYSTIMDTLAQFDLIEQRIEQATEALKLSRAKVVQQLLPQSAVAEAQKVLLKAEEDKTLTHYDLTLAYNRLELATGGWKGQAP